MTDKTIGNAIVDEKSDNTNIIDVITIKKGDKNAL